MIDHLVFATPELEAAIEDLEQRLGVRAAPGGRHSGRGTHNALLGLGSGAYLEIIAPDPGQPTPAGGLPFGLGGLDRPRLAWWAARSTDIDGQVRRALERGYDPGTVVGMSRERPDGVRLEWRLALGAWPAAAPLVPFLIDWGATPHPSAAAPAGVRLLELRGEHPDPPSIQELLAALEVRLPVVEARDPALVALLDTPRGRVELR